MSKRKSPAFSFYPNDWFEGTMLLTVSQRGSYIDLLALSWVRGGFTKEQAYLAVRGSDPKDIDVVLAEKFDESESGWFTNARLEKEREKQGKRSSSASMNGKKGGRPKSQLKAREKATGKAKPKPPEKLSDLDLVSVLDKGARSPESNLTEGPSGFTPPTVEEVQAFADMQKRLKPGWPKEPFDADAFCDHYASNGWRQGNGVPIVDWKASVRSWGRRIFGGANSQESKPKDEGLDFYRRMDENYRGDEE